MNKLLYTLLFLFVATSAYCCDDVVSQVDTVKMERVYRSLKYAYSRDTNKVDYFVIKSNKSAAHHNADTLCVRTNKTKFFTDKKFILRRENFTKVYNSNYTVGIDGDEYIPPFACVENSKCKIRYTFCSLGYFELDAPAYIVDSSLTISKFRVGQTKEEFWKILNRKDIPNKESYDIVCLINTSGRDSYLINEVDLYVEFVDSKISCIIIL